MAEDVMARTAARSLFEPPARRGAERLFCAPGRRMQKVGR